jgi:hypothetical protein
MAEWKNAGYRINGHLSHERTATGHYRQMVHFNVLEGNKYYKYDKYDKYQRKCSKDEGVIIQWQRSSVKIVEFRFNFG